MLNHFKKTKDTIEIAALDSMSYPYILFDTEGAFIRAHDDICDVLQSFDFGENEMRYPNALIAGLTSCAWEGSEALQHYYRNKMIAASHRADEILFAGLIKHKKHIFYAHMQKMPCGSFVCFKDIYGDYALNKASDAICRSSRGIKNILKASQRKKTAAQDNHPLYSLAGNV